MYQDFPFTYLIGRRLLIPSQRAFYLLISSLVIQPVYPPIQGEHAATFPAPVALEHVSRLRKTAIRARLSSAIKS